MPNHFRRRNASGLSLFVENELFERLELPHFVDFITQHFNLADNLYIRKCPSIEKLSMNYRK